jgi:hypothetical protein
MSGPLGSQQNMNKSVGYPDFGNAPAPSLSRSAADVVTSALLEDVAQAVQSCHREAQRVERERWRWRLALHPNPKNNQSGPGVFGADACQELDRFPPFPTQPGEQTFSTPPKQTASVAFVINCGNRNSIKGIQL